MVDPLLTDYDALLRRALADLAERADSAEVPDPRAKWTPGGAHAVYPPMAALALAYFDPLSPRAGEEALWAKLRRFVEALGRFQHDDGLIDLHTSNFHSPPDTAFMVELLAPLYEVVRDVADLSERRDGLLARLEGIIIAACDGMVGAGVHTPNHRWKLASALVLADALWPHESWRSEARAYLDEGIDIDQDGEFTERSTGCYNEVCDRSLILLGRALGREDLLALADRNLEHVLHLLHADGTLVTTYSLRQDRHTTVGVERYLMLYWYRAMTAGNGRFLAAAELGLRRLTDSGGSLAALAVWLRHLHEAGGAAPPRPEPLPEDYEARFDRAGVVRRRAGELSLTLMAGWDDLLAVRFGAGPELTVRIAAGLAPGGQFLAGGIAGGAGRYRLRSHHACEYFGPGPDPLPAVDWRRRGGFSRRVFVSTELTMALDVKAAGDGLRLRLRSEGCRGVPLELALLIRDAAAVEPAGRAEHDERTRKHFLNSGQLVIRGAECTVRIGPGIREHGLVEIPTGRAHPVAGAWCLRPVTPVDVTLTMSVPRGA